MDLYLTRDGPVVDVAVDGELTIRSRHMLRAAVFRELEQGARHFRLDFERVAYIDAAGLGGLVTLWKAVRAARGELRLTKLNRDLRELIALTKLDMLMESDDDDPGTAGRPAPIHPTRGPLEGREQAEPPPPEERPG